MGFTITRNSPAGHWGAEGNEVCQTKRIRKGDQTEILDLAQLISTCSSPLREAHPPRIAALWITLGQALLRFDQ